MVSNAYMEDPKKHRVNFVQSHIFCDCKESIMYGVPCRHELAVTIMILKDVSSLYFAPRWEKSYFTFEDFKLDKEDNKDEEVSFINKS